MNISMIAAMGQEQAIGVNNRLPWSIPEELAWFRKCTLNKSVLMGRKTFESIGQALPQRHNMVLTKQRDFYAEGVDVVRHFHTAVGKADRLDNELVIIGGGTLYEQSIAFANRIYLTFVEMEVPNADTWFPCLGSRFKCTYMKVHKSSKSINFVTTIWER